MNDDPVTLKDIARALTFHQLTPEQWKQWKAQMRRQPRWFVLGCPGLKGARWRALAGPFDTPEEAQRVADEYAHDGSLDGGFRLDRAYRTLIKSLPETLRIYRNNVIQLVEDLAEAEQADRPSPSTPSPRKGAAAAGLAG